MKSQRAFTRILLVTLFSYFAVGCRHVKFSNSPAVASSAKDVYNIGGDPGPITGTGNTPAADLPKIQFIAPACQRGSDCLVTFQLDKAYPDQTEFDWETDDSLYGQAVPSGQAPWGQAGVQYVSTYGHVVFGPGTTSQTVKIRDINPQETAISIGVLMNNCVYNTLLEDCSKFFPSLPPGP